MRTKSPGSKKAHGEEKTKNFKGTTEIEQVKRTLSFKAQSKLLQFTANWELGGALEKVVTKKQKRNHSRKEAKQSEKPPEKLGQEH